jgi:phosphoribosyl 1,2-cyclic phosphodiesterase
MRVYILGSGSSGNAMLIQSATTRVLVDAGFGPRAAVTRLRSLGADLFPRGVDAIVVTHQHSDHFAHVEPLARALRCPLYLHAGIEAKRVRQRYPVRELVLKRKVEVGDIAFDAIEIPHDAPQVALRFHGPNGTFGLATDLGWAPAAVARFLGECDAALVEANHCERLLAAGPYPPRLKRRVGSDVGHLNNEQTAALAARMVGTRLRRIVLGHISRSNNDPRLALETVRRACRGISVEALPHGQPRTLEVRRAATQLSLFA